MPKVYVHPRRPIYEIQQYGIYGDPASTMEAIVAWLEPNFPNGGSVTGTPDPNGEPDVPGAWTLAWDTGAGGGSVHVVPGDLLLSGDYNVEVYSSMDEIQKRYDIIR